jgi:hypothetical protein
MHSAIVILAMMLAAAGATSAQAQTGAVVVGKGPGVAGAAKTVEITATITAIDPKKREVTLKGPQGNEVVVEAGSRVRNFSQMKVGDQVNVEYVEALTLELKKGGGQPVARTTDAVVADVVNVDPQTQTVTLRGPERTVDLKVRDPKQFALIAKGDQVEATYAQALAVKVERVKDTAPKK